MVTIGLFGTCGGSQWRAPFKDRYEAQGIQYFDPQVDNWTPEMAEIEAHHLVNDQVILFPITAETYATGSLAETGFSILSAVRANTDRFVVIYIDKGLDQSLIEANPALAKESMRGRALVKAHLNKLDIPNVFFVDSLEEMYETSVQLHSVATTLDNIRNKKPVLENLLGLGS